jgi:hypothetical protein
LEFYFLGGGSGMALVLVPGVLAAGLWLLAAYLTTGRAARSMWGAIWAAVGLGLWLLLPTGYFLAHTIATQYYQFPTYVVFLTGLAFVVLRWSEERQDEVVPGGARGASLAGAGIVAVAILFMTWSLPPLGDDQAFAMPDVTLPEPLREPNAWILGDRFVGTLWHYHGIVGQQIRELPPDVSLFLDFLASVYLGKPAGLDLRDIYRVNEIVLAARDAADQHRFMRL